MEAVRRERNKLLGQLAEAKKEREGFRDALIRRAIDRFGFHTDECGSDMELIDCINTMGAERNDLRTKLAESEARGFSMSAELSRCCNMRWDVEVYHHTGECVYLEKVKDKLSESKAATQRVIDKSVESVGVISGKLQEAENKLAEAQGQFFYDMAKWAAQRWEDQVRHRPEKNYLRAGLDSAWKFLESYCLEQREGIGEARAGEEG